MIIESDYMIMVQTIQAANPSLSLLGNLCQDVKRLMQMFPHCCIQHVGRLGNLGADTLAKYAWHIEELVVCHSRLCETYCLVRQTRDVMCFPQF